MANSEKPNCDLEQPSLRLTRRSLVAAAGILVAVGPGAAGKALANGGGGGGRGGNHGGGGGNRGGGGHGGGGRGDGHGGGGHGGGGHGGRGGGYGHKCFLAGTRVLTPTGEVAVEALEEGDLVVTENGAAREVLWVGRTTINRDGEQRFNEDALPVRISKGALGEDCPRRDLYLSRAHMLHLDGVLIPVSDLVNGLNIAVAYIDVDAIVYYHIALDRHDVLMAEGAPCESLLVTAKDALGFDNAEELRALFGSSAVSMVPYAPIASSNGGRAALMSRLRSAFAPVIDLRRPADMVRDKLEGRAELSRAA